MTGTPKRILIVDDEADVRFVLKTALERSGFATLEASNGEEGLAMIRQERPDAVLLDIMMPKMNGISVNQTLKSDPATASIPVLIITGKGAMKELEDLRRDLDVVAYLEKPFPVSVLISKLAEMFAAA